MGVGGATRHIGGGFTSIATTLAAGTNSWSSSSRFAANVLVKRFTPVTLPPGRLRLATKPSCTGSPPFVNTIGIVVVTDLAAIAETLPPVATIIATWRRTRSVANQVVDRIETLPNGIRSLRSDPRYSRPHSSPDGIQLLPRKT